MKWRNEIMEFTRWTDDELEYIKENYQDKSYKEIGEYLGRKEQAIRSKLHYLGLKKGIHHCNYNYFEIIDTEDKAYWLGFIYADGNINKAKNTLTINLQGRDYKHLEKLNKCIDGNFAVKRFDANKKGHVYKMCQILVYSTKMAKDLINYGVIPHKTDKIIFPELPHHLIRHFIRGYFDGDGSICERKHKKGLSDLACSFTCGNQLFLEKLRTILFQNNIKSYLVKDKRGEKFSLSLAGLQNPDVFLHYIYDDATIYLDRKYLKKEELYKCLNIEQRLLRQSEKTGFINLSEKENGNPEMEIRVEGCV